MDTKKKINIQTNNIIVLRPSVSEEKGMPNDPKKNKIN